jgi:Pyridoxamine 5'-phosphate oxidase
VTESRSVSERIADALRLFQRDVDCFFATTNPDQRPNVVPLSAVWHADTFVLCTRRSTRTVANITGRPFARLVYGTARDVVLIDADCDIQDLDRLARDALTAFHEHVGWDIATESSRYVALTCRPHTVKSWRQEPEATLMRDRVWLR